ncbi:hypothetical protein ABTE52_22155, partial [Acinetobacter baumannii]
TMPLDEFRTKFPLGSKNQVVVVDSEGSYVGLASVPEAHSPDVAAFRLDSLLYCRNVVLHPEMNIRDAMVVFEGNEAESLAV